MWPDFSIPRLLISYSKDEIISVVVSISLSILYTLDLFWASLENSKHNLSALVVATADKLFISSIVAIADKLLSALVVDTE